MTRYFPDVVEAVLANFPEKCVIDGEIVLVSPSSRRPPRLRPCSSSASTRPRHRVKKLAAETPASFVAFDLLALGEEST